MRTLGELKLMLRVCPQRLDEEEIDRLVDAAIADQLDEEEDEALYTLLTQTETPSMQRPTLSEGAAVREDGRLVCHGWLCTGVQMTADAAMLELRLSVFTSTLGIQHVLPTWLQGDWRMFLGGGPLK